MAKPRQKLDFATGIRLTKDIADRIQKLADKDGRSFNNVVVRLLEKALLSEKFK